LCNKQLTDVKLILLEIYIYCLRFHLIRILLSLCFSSYQEAEQKVYTRYFNSRIKNMIGANIKRNLFKA
jgi:hypothetical protein